jgi:hypothetical protein
MPVVREFGVGFGDGSDALAVNAFPPNKIPFIAIPPVTTEQILIEELVEILNHFWDR